MVQRRTLTSVFSHSICLNIGIYDGRLPDIWEKLRERGHWTSSFAKHLNDWELKIIEDFIPLSLKQKL